MDRAQTDIAIDNVFANYIPYENRIRAASASIRDHNLSKSYLMMAEEQGIASSIQFGWMGESGAKYRTSGIYNYYSRAYSLVGANDAIQTTTANQPILVGNIETGGKYALGNPNGGYTFMTHTSIPFADVDFSITAIINSNGDSGGGYSRICGNSSSSSATKLMMHPSSNILYVTNDANTSYQFNGVKYRAKNSILHIVRIGTTLYCYVNGALISSQTCTGTFTFNSIFTSVPLYGTLSAYIIRSQGLVSTQVLAEYNHLRSVFPEIPSITIGSQIWATSNFNAVTTAQGNIIPEMQAATNVEKIVNGGFNTDLASFTTVGSTMAVWNSGVAEITHTSAYVAGSNEFKQGTPAVQNRYYILSMRVKSISGANTFGYQVDNGFGTTSVINTTSFTTITRIYQYTGTTGTPAFRCGISGAGVFQVDDISILEIGWSGSQTLYDGIYAQTSGTTEQKTYAAVKAAAMWCHYNNDAALGAVYGKLYNLFAVKLLQMDIDYFNTANPITPWGWRVPTAADFAALSTALGGDTVSGGKMKVVGTTYWITPNTSADNSSGLSMVPSGLRDTAGSFANVNQYGILWGSDTYRLKLQYDLATTQVGSIDNRFGVSVRLIKV